MYRYRWYRPGDVNLLQNRHICVTVSLQRPPASHVICQSQPAVEEQEVPFQATALFPPIIAKDLSSLIAQKKAELQHFDVLAMDRAAAILMWGRSGSLLLASYLDGHEDVIMLPEDFSQKLYEFFEDHRNLSLAEKLMESPAFYPGYDRFFKGPFAISSTQYYAAIQAILEVSGQWPSEFLESRRAFFVLAHIAYTLALGRRPASSTPLIVYQQHVWNNAAARNLVEDFPQAKFIHTVRDPISSVDGVFQYHLHALAEHHLFLPYSAFEFLANKDRPQLGMESRTWAVRFEDLHLATEATMHALSDWLGLSYRNTLLDSTFNGIPWVVTRDGVSWSGRRLQNVQRRSSNLSPLDRALMFVFFYENFVEWNYPFPKLLRYRIVRLAVFVFLFLLPTKMEVVAAREVFKKRILRSLRQRDFLGAIKLLGVFGFCRVKIVALMTPALFSRRARAELVRPVH